MTVTHRRSRSALLVVALAVACACSGPEPDGVWRPIERSAADEGALARATAAREALASALLAELSEALAQGGPGAGVRVCSERAPAIALEVARAHDVGIGRTSQRLRNPDNAPPDWAAAAVAGESAEPRAFVGPGGALGVLDPIRLGTPCLVCHGAPESLAPDVVDVLAERYPQDRATGFAAGDLRGWFWVEVGP